MKSWNWDDLHGKAECKIFSPDFMSGARAFVAIDQRAAAAAAAAAASLLCPIKRARGYGL